VPNTFARYRIAARASFAKREWDDDVVVYCDDSGATHQLGPLSGLVLQSLEQAEVALSAPDIDRQHQIVWEGGALESQRLAQIEAVLVEFTQIGLAEIEPC
jgi:hypothetical protein